MDRIIQQAIAKMGSSVRSSPSWKPDDPWKQDYYTYGNLRWSAYQRTASKDRFTALALYSWNVDFMLPFPDSRMKQALKCLEEQVVTQQDNIATVIYLQECLQSDLELLAGHSWIREHFLLSDLNTSNWSSSYYGTVTLVDKRLDIADAFRLHYSKSNMQRDAFFTDIQLGTKLVRLGNSHLESMAFMPAMRPHQVALAAKYMHAADGAVLAGDFNAIQDFDQTLHTENNLKDAYLELGGTEFSDAGYTWGQQASTSLRRQFGLSRMDKIFYCGELRLQSFERFGADVQTDDKDEQETIVSLGFDKPWITDHLGVKAIFDLGEGNEQKL